MFRTRAFSASASSRADAPGLSRRGLLRGSAIGAFTAAVGIERLATGVRRVYAAPPPDAFAQSALGAQLAWFLAAVNDGGATLTEAEIGQRIAPGFLAIVPPAHIIGLIQGLAAGYGGFTLQGLTRLPTATQAVALVQTAAGPQLVLPIAIEATATSRITGLTLYPALSGDGAAIFPMTKASSETATLIEIGGRGLYRAEAGSGGPTVVFEAGLGDSAATWAGIIPAVAGITRVFSYDRANTIAGASDPAPTPRTAADAVADLHAVLTAASVPGPYVLVGHSVGGIFARLFASTYPEVVAGLVLVDASHEEQEVRRQTMVSPELFAAEQQAVGANPEGIDLPASFARMRLARETAPLRPMPLVVISAGQADPAGYPPGWPMDAEQQLHNELQADLANLVPGGRHIIAERSSHYVQQYQPELIVAVIREMVQEIMEPGVA